MKVCKAMLLVAFVKWGLGLHVNLSLGSSLPVQLLFLPYRTLRNRRALVSLLVPTMSEPTKDLDKLRKEQEKDDTDLLAELDKEGREFDKVKLSSKES